MTAKASRSTAYDPIPLPTERRAPLEPPEALAALRSDGGVHRLRYPDGHVGWLVTSYELGRKVLCDKRFSLCNIFRSPSGDQEKRAAHAAAVRAPEISAGIMATRDRPEHTRLRRSVARHFTVRALEDRRTRITDIVRSRLDVMEESAQPVDFVETFALAVSSLTLCDLFVLPPSDRSGFERFTAVQEEPDASVEDKIEATLSFRAYARDVVRRKRAEPADDLLSDLIHAGDFSEDQVVGMIVQMLTAGHDTMNGTLALSCYLLLQEPSVWERLRADPAAIDNAVEELLRYLTLIQTGAFTRTATEDVELADVVVREGEGVTVSLTAANRDPTRFPDPDRFDIDRDARGHLAFGHGVHMCLGQHLARLVMQIGLTELIQRFPSLRLAIPAEDVRLYADDVLVRGVYELPVRF